MEAIFLDAKNLFRFRFIFIFLAALSLVALLLYRVRVGEVFLTNSRSRDGLAMNTIISVSVSSKKTPGEIDLILDGAFELIENLDKRLSMHDASSDISRVNAAAGLESIRVAPEVAGVVASAIELSAATNGAFDPTIGPVVALWRIGDTENPRHNVPGADEIAEALSLVDYRRVKTTGPDELFLERTGMMLDLGGVAKGYASGAVGDYLRASGVESALVDLGGNVLVVGGRANGEPWRIGVQHPFGRRGEPLCSVAVRDSSVITAGVYERFAMIGGKKYPHIFNTRTGFPVNGDLLSVTVVTNDPTAGDALSTAFMVMGKDDSMKLMKELVGVEAIFVSTGDDGEPRVTATEGLRNGLVMFGNETRR
jgi:thiamine biosynthesis lipoprotein